MRFDGLNTYETAVAELSRNWRRSPLDEREARKLIEERRRIDEIFIREPDLVIVEEIAERVGDRIARRRDRQEPEPSVEPEVRQAERIIRQFEVDKTDVPIRQTENIIKTTDPGFLIEVTLRADVNTFSCSYTRDSEIRHYTYAQMYALRASPVIGAGQEADTNLYYVQFRNLRWRQRFSFNIQPTEPTTFANLRALWEVETYE